MRAPIGFNQERNGYFYTELWYLPKTITFEGQAEDRVAWLAAEFKRLTNSKRELLLQEISSLYPDFSNKGIVHD